MNWLRCLTVLTTMSACGVAAAQTYPERPIRLIVPFSPGQGADSAARLVANALGEKLGQPLVIENRPGAGGNIGAEAAANAEPDGYTLLVGSNGTHAANAALYASLPFDPLADFEPISYIGSVAMVLLSAPDFDASDVQDVIDMARREPGELSVAVPSSTARVVFELLSKTAGVDLHPVPYKASANAMNDLIGHHIPLSIDTVIAAGPQVSGGNLKALGVSSGQRSAALPDVQTFAEAGLSNFDLAAWNVWFAPAGTDPTVIETLNRGLGEVLSDAAIQDQLRALGYEPEGTQNPAEVKDFVHNEAQTWGDLIRGAGISAG